MVPKWGPGGILSTSLLLLTRGLFVQSLEGDARLALAARLQPDAVDAVGVDQAVGHVPRPGCEAAALVALQRGR